MSWSELARAAARSLSTGDERDDDSVTARLIRDIYAIFSANGRGRMKTADLLAELHAIEESPWGDWYGKPLAAHGLSRLFRPYRIKTMPVRADGETVRGYKLEQFADAFAQLALHGVTAVTPESPSQAGSNARNTSNASSAQPVQYGRPLIGDEMYPILLADAVKDGHLSDDEAEKQYELHKLVAAAQADSDADEVE